MVKKKLFLQIQNINIMYPNEVNMIIVPNNKKNRDYYGYPWLSHFTDELWLEGKWWKQKLFLQIQSINIVYPNKVNMIAVTNNKKIEIITGINVCLILRMNINYKENGEKKRFSCKSNTSISCIPMSRTWLQCP